MKVTGIAEVNAVFVRNNLLNIECVAWFSNQWRYSR